MGQQPHVCGVVGDPIEHSLSPVLHRAAYDATGLDWTYGAHRVPAGGLGAFVGALGGEWRGLSVTAPLKREALAMAHDVTPRARLAGGVNTLILGDGAAPPIRGDNTDLPGAVAAVEERYAGPVTAGTVIGGGATAASTGLALVELGARRIRILARSLERAAPAAGAIAAHPAAPQVEVAPIDTRPLGEVVVTTIPAQAQTPDLVERCAAAAAVFEVVYDPWPTPMTAAAVARGQRVIGGLDLLVHQAALQFTAFTGAPAPLGAMRAAGEDALAERVG
jgi:shikimate dehydrogenase